MPSALPGRCAVARLLVGGGSLCGRGKPSAADGAVSAGRPRGEDGDDEIDYELDNDLRKLWAESLDVVKTMRRQATSRNGGDEAMPDLADGVIDAAGVLSEGERELGI